MPPEPRRSTTREELARLLAQVEASKEANTRMTVGVHQLLENVREDLRGVAERMATAEQFRRLEDRVMEVDRRLSEHAPIVGVVPGLAAKVDALEKTAVRTDAQEKLLARVDALEKASATHALSVDVIPRLEQRQDQQEHRNSRMGGALWVVGAVVGLLGLAGLRECGRWFVQTLPPPAQYAPQLQAAPPPVTHRQQ